jgi:hypothetical protein
MAKAVAIAEGRLPNEVSESHRGVMGEARVREEIARLVDLGRLVADPVYVRTVEWGEMRSSLSRFYLYHYDAVPLLTGKRLDMLGQFFHTHLQTRDLPDLRRIMLPAPILDTGWGGTGARSLMAIEAGELAGLLRRFLVWAGFVRRYTARQRAEHLARTGRELPDQYWEVKAHPVTAGVAGTDVPFDLFLPSGMEYEVTPALVPGQPIRFRLGPADPLVAAAGYKVFCGDLLDVPMSLETAGPPAGAVPVLVGTDGRPLAKG